MNILSKYVLVSIAFLAIAHDTQAKRKQFPVLPCDSDSDKEITDTAQETFPLSDQLAGPRISPSESSDDEYYGERVRRTRVNRNLSPLTNRSDYSSSSSEEDQEQQPSLTQQFEQILDRIVADNYATDEERDLDFTLLQDFLEMNSSFSDILFIRNGSEYRPLTYAIRNLNIRLMRELLPYEDPRHIWSNINAFDYLSTLPIDSEEHRQFTIDALELLFDSITPDGASPNYEIRNHFGRTPLIQAIYDNNHIIVDELLVAGANPNTPEIIDGQEIHPLVIAQAREEDEAQDPDFLVSGNADRTEIITLLLNAEGVEIPADFTAYPAGFRRPADQDGSEARRARCE